MDWSGVDYCDVFISRLDSHFDGTHSLQKFVNLENSQILESWLSWRLPSYYVHFIWLRSSVLQNANISKLLFDFGILKKVFSIPNLLIPLP